MLNFKVDKDLCTLCGDCAKVCYPQVIDQSKDHLPQIRSDREPLCQKCQQCLAVCPTAAISIHNRTPTGSIEISDNAYPGIAKMMLLVRGRRSFRHYKNQNVSTSFIGELLTAIAHAPTGNNNQRLTFTVLDDILTMKSFQERMITSLSEKLGHPRQKDDWFLDNIASTILERGPSAIFYNAPHLLIVSSPLTVYTAREDIIIALSYFDLLAQSAGLGTVWCGIVKSMLESLPELKEILKIPENHYYFPMLFGLPDIKYHRTVQRDDAANIQKIKI
jgi:ferredoxin